MPQRNSVSTSNPPQTPETSAYLTELSQCAFNIKTILVIHTAESHFYEKHLEHLYHMEKGTLSSLLAHPVGINTFAFDELLLEDNLLNNDYDTPGVKEKIEIAKKELLFLLGNIQREREKSPTYTKAETGLKDGPVREHILNLINEGKKSYNKNLLGNTNVIAKKGGEYEYNERRIVFSDKSTHYYHVFDAIFSNQSSVYEISYEDLKRKLPQGFREMDKKSIQNAFTNTIWRTVLLEDGNHIENVNGKGDKIISFKKGVIFVKNTN